MEGDDTLPFVSVNVQILDGFKGYDLFLSCSEYVFMCSRNRILLYFTSNFIPLQRPIGYGRLSYARTDIVMKTR